MVAHLLKPVAPEEFERALANLSSAEGMAG
jgi:hypothetical protein